MERRHFLDAPLFVPALAFGANDRIAYVSRVFQKLGAQCVAVCDVYEPHIEAARKDAPDCSAGRR